MIKIGVFEGDSATIMKQANGGRGGKDIIAMKMNNMKMPSTWMWGQQLRFEGGCEYLGSYLPPTREDCLVSCGFSHFFRPAGPPQPQYSRWTPGCPAESGHKCCFQDTGDLVK